MSTSRRTASAASASGPLVTAPAPARRRANTPTRAAAAKKAAPMRSGFSLVDMADLPFWTSGCLLLVRPVGLPELVGQHLHTGILQREIGARAPCPQIH